MCHSDFWRPKISKNDSSTKCLITPFSVLQKGQINPHVYFLAPIIKMWLSEVNERARRRPDQNRIWAQTVTTLLNFFNHCIENKTFSTIALKIQRIIKTYPLFNGHIWPIFSFIQIEHHGGLMCTWPWCPFCSFGLQIVYSFHKSEFVINLVLSEGKSQGKSSP